MALQTMRQMCKAVGVVKMRNVPRGPHFFGSFPDATYPGEPTITGDGGIKCTTRLDIATSPDDSDESDAATTRMCNFQSTVVIPDGGGVLMTASNGKTAQAGREIVVFLQVGVVKPTKAGADPRNAPR